MSVEICDRCEHLVSDHERRTKYSDRACSKRNKKVARIHEETKEGVIHELAGAVMVCMCDGLVVRA